MYHGDAVFHCFIRVVDLNLLPIQINLSRVHLVNTEKTFHQGRLAGSVLTHQCMNGSGTKGKLYIVKRFNTWERFADTL